MKKDISTKSIKANGVKGEQIKKAKNGKKKQKQDKKKIENVKEQVDQVITADLIKVVDTPKPVNGKKVNKVVKKEKKQKVAGDVTKTEQKPATTNKAEEGSLSQKDLAKIEKKKAKKLAQKLKKQTKKAQDKTEVSSEQTNKPKSDDKKEKTSKKKLPKEVPTAKKPVKVTAPITKTTNPKKLRKVEKKKLLKAEQDDEEPRIRDPILKEATVFVGNLPINTKRVQLIRLFEDYKPVNSIRFRTAGGKNIFKHKARLQAGTLNAYVVLKDAETATRALTLNGVEFKSNHLRVSKGDHDVEEVDAKRQIFIGNLKYSANDEKLREIFSSCGEIEYVRCLQEGDKGCKGVAYISFKSPEAVGLALELNETMLDERPIHVERYSVRKLGAKATRDANTAAQAGKKPVTGAKKRVNDKQKKKGGPNNKVAAADADAKKKKSEFRGVKVDATKKKQKQKKKPSSQMQQLAKKIAPKAE